MSFPYIYDVFTQGSTDPGAYRGPPLLATRLEEQAFSRLLDGIEVAVRPKWAHSVNRLLVENTIPRLNAKVGQFYSVRECVNFTLTRRNVFVPESRRGFALCFVCALAQ